MAGIGDYKPIKLVKYTTSVDGNGDQSQSSQTFTFWAEVSDNGGGRSQVDGRTRMGMGKNFKIWFRVNEFLNGDWKIEYFGETYAVTNVERIGEKRFNCLITGNVQS